MSELRLSPAETHIVALEETTRRLGYADGFLGRGDHGYIVITLASEGAEFHYFWRRNLYSPLHSITRADAVARFAAVLPAQESVDPFAGLV